MWFLYVVCCADRSLYVGIATDLDRRISEHNEGKRGARYTRGRRPVRLVARWPVPDRSAAAKAEHSFKRLTRAQKLQAVESGALPGEWGGSILQT